MENACNGVIRLDVEERIHEHEEKSLDVTQTKNKEIKMWGENEQSIQDL